MAKYHINPETGRPNVCNAVYRCLFSVDGVPPEHYDSKEAAREAYEKIMDDKSLTTFSKKSNLQNKNGKRIHSDKIDQNNRIDFLKAQKVVDHFRNAGFPITLAKDIQIKFYHDTGAEDKQPPTKINSYDPNSTSAAGLGKPAGVLWLSSGAAGYNGKIVTSWREWSKAEDWGNACESPKTYEVELSPDAVIIELNEHNVGRINNTADATLPRFINNGEISFITGMDNPINWSALQNSGIDAVRINGTSNRGYFYGYDVDSLIILNGDKVKGFIEKPGAQSKDDLDGYPLYDIYQRYVNYST